MERRLKKEFTSIFVSGGCVKLYHFFQGGGGGGG